LKFLAPLFLLGVAATAPQRQPLTVRQVVEHYAEFDGKIIRVEGVVYGCQMLGCSLLDVDHPRDYGFGLGTAPGFDEQIRLHLHKKVIVEGRLDATCLHTGETKLPNGQFGLIICTDRASALKDPKLIEIAE